MLASSTKPKRDLEKTKETKEDRGTQKGSKFKCKNQREKEEENREKTI
jgi:hypothetical protein